MKKTLITLMALAGVASAAEVTHTTLAPNTGWTSYLNNGITKAITTTGYQTGDAFTLNFTVTWNHVYSEVKDGSTLLGYSLTGTYGVTGPGFNNYESSNILTLATFEGGNTWGIFTQAGMYIAMENTTTNERGWGAPTGVDGTNFTWTSESTTGADLLDSWVSLDPSYTGGAVNSDGQKAKPGIVNLSVEVDVTSAGSTITLGMANGVKAIIETAYVLDANQLSFTSRDIGTSNVTFSSNGQTVIIPEPATATLSLLALAGLAARRRRK